MLLSVLLSESVDQTGFLFLSNYIQSVSGAETSKNEALIHRLARSDVHEMCSAPGAYAVQQFVSLQGVELQVSWSAVQHHGPAARVHHQVGADAFS